MSETPQLVSSSYNTKTLDWDIKWGEGQFSAPVLGRRADDRLNQFLLQHQQLTPEATTQSMHNQRRIIQVFIADPDQNVPLDSALLYRGDQKLTDLTDQELF